MSRLRSDSVSFDAFHVQAVAGRQIPLAMVMGVIIYAMFPIIVFAGGGRYSRDSLLLLLIGCVGAVAAAGLCFTMAQRGRISGVVAGVMLFQCVAVVTFVTRARLDNIGTSHVLYLTLIVLLPTPLVVPNRLLLGVNLALVLGLLAAMMFADPDAGPHLVRQLGGFILACSVVLAYLWRMSLAAIWSYFRLLQDARERSSTDALTGLPNRAAWTEQVQSWIGGKSQGTPAQASVLYMDMDDMKLVNDQFGHAAGDRLLVEIADTLRKSLPATTMLARFGGDEFVAFFPDTGPETVARVIDRLQASISQNTLTRNQTIGVGVAEYRHPEPMDTALERADANLIETKRLRRTRLELSPPTAQGEPGAGLMTARSTVNGC